MDLLFKQISGRNAQKFEEKNFPMYFWTILLSHGLKFKLKITYPKIKVRWQETQWTLPGKTKISYFDYVFRANEAVSRREVPVDVIVPFQVSHSLANLKGRIHVGLRYLADDDFFPRERQRALQFIENNTGNEEWRARNRFRGWEKRFSWDWHSREMGNKTSKASLEIALPTIFSFFMREYRRVK